MNKVLIGLRQDQISGSTTELTEAYDVLLLQFLNEAKEEVEESWDWNALRTTVTVTLSAATSDYTLTSAGDADVDTTHRSRLLYERSPSFGGGESSVRTFGDQPQLFDVTDSGEVRLQQVGIEQMERLHFTDDDESSDPRYFSLYHDGTSLKMKVWPTPADTRTIKARIFNPQAELASDTLTTVLSVPERPVWTLCLYKANEERGEEVARPNGPNFVAARDSLAVAIQREMTIHDMTGYPM
jgi:hypothetical protein